MRVLQNVMLGTVLCAVGMSVVGAAVAQAPAPVADRWSQLSAANDLDHEGATPFHLKMTFQLYDLMGKPAETGTVEEWWISPGSKRIIVTAASLKEDGTPLSDDAPGAARESYLVSELIEAVLQPLAEYGKLPVEIVGEHTKTFGKIQLNCISPKLPGHNPTISGMPNVCAEAKTDDVRFLLNPLKFESLVRNAIGQFHGVYVAQDVQLNMMDLSAINGKITQLQDVDPAKSGVEQKAPEIDGSHASPDLAKTDPMLGGVIAGHLIKTSNPIYPAAAKMRRANGAVLLRVLISKEGDVRNIVVMATSDADFTNPAVEAVQKWKFSAFTLNGKPTEAHTFITVNFQTN